MGTRKSWEEGYPRYTNRGGSDRLTRVVLAPFCTWLAVREGMHFGTPLVPRPAEILLFDAVRHPATPYQHGDADAGEPHHNVVPFPSPTQYARYRFRSGMKVERWSLPKWELYQ